MCGHCLCLRVRVCASARGSVNACAGIRKSFLWYGFSVLMSTRNCKSRLVLIFFIHQKSLFYVQWHGTGGHTASLSTSSVLNSKPGWDSAAAPLPPTAAVRHVLYGSTAAPAAPPQARVSCCRPSFTHSTLLGHSLCLKTLN